MSHGVREMRLKGLAEGDQTKGNIPIGHAKGKIGREGNEVFVFFKDCFVE